jgi:hypothetical protein
MTRIQNKTVHLQCNEQQNVMTALLYHKRYSFYASVMCLNVNALRKSYMT